MGDRSNIVIQEGNGNRVWLYGHWMGNDSIQIVRDVLSRYDRWNDAPYLARMLFSEMVKGSIDEATGYGISTYMLDSEYPIIVLTPAQTTFHIEDESGEIVSTVISFSTFLEEHAGDCDLYELVQNMNTMNGVLDDA